MRAADQLPVSSIGAHAESTHAALPRACVDLLDQVPPSSPAVQATSASNVQATKPRGSPVGDPARARSSRPEALQPLHRGPPDHVSGAPPAKEDQGPRA